MTDDEQQRVEAALNAAHACGCADTVARLHAIHYRGADVLDALLLETFDHFVHDQIAQLDELHAGRVHDHYVVEQQRLIDEL